MKFLILFVCACVYLSFDYTTPIDWSSLDSINAYNTGLASSAIGSLNDFSIAFDNGISFVSEWTSNVLEGFGSLVSGVNSILDILGKPVSQMPIISNIIDYFENPNFPWN